MQLKNLVNDSQYRIKLLHELVESQCYVMQDKTAIITSQRSITYAELSSYSNQVAHYLKLQNVKPNQLVAIVMEKSWEQVVAILGIMKAGAAYLPISIHEPKARLKNILEQGDVKFLISQDKYIDYFNDQKNIKTIGISNLPWDAINNKPLYSIQNIDDLAYVIFTSGSTGNPKGVMLSHQSVINTILDINEKFQINQNDCVLALSGLNFDLSVYDIFGLLIAGGKLIIPSERETKDPLAWKNWINNENITIWNSVPAYMQIMVDSHPGILKSLRLVLLSGDWIPLSLPKKIQMLNLGIIEVVSLGGATEASIWSILYPITDIHKDWISIPYGKAMKNQTIKVLDENLNQLPANEIGQIYIGGEGLAKGYWKNETLTKKSFVKNKQGKCLYATGDLGRLNEDGNIEFLGRMDYQIKINGYRVELGEIETVLENHKNIQKAVVGTYHNRLVIYYSTVKNISKKSVKAYLTKKLPSYMVPKYYIQLKEFYLSNNGKIDRKSLPQPKSTDLISDHIYKLPRADEEILIADIWKKILNIEQVGVEDNFFELGGDSLTAIKALMEINEKFDSNISLKNFFDNPRLSNFKNQINNQKSSRIKIVKSDQMNDIPLTLEQKSIWLHEKTMNDPLIYNESINIKLHKKISKSSLLKAIDTIMQRHQELHSRVYVKNNEPMQKIVNFKEINFKSFNLSNLESKLARKKMLSIVSRDVKTPFDLSKEDPIRFILIELPKGAPILFITAHHLFIDGIAIYNTFLAELAIIYQSIEAQEEVTLPSLSFNFKDYALYKEKENHEKMNESDLIFWQEKLAGLTPLQIPTKQAKQTTMSCVGSHIPFKIPEKISEAVKKYCKKQNVTIFNFLFTSFNALLHHYSQQDDILTYTVSGGRTIPGTEKLMGLFINNLLVRIPISEDQTFLNLLNKNQNELKEIILHEVSFQKLIDSLSLSSQLNNMLKIAFVIEPTASDNKFKWQPNQLLAHSGRSKFDFLMELDVKQKNIVGRIEYNANLFEAFFIKDFITFYKHLLIEILTKPNILISNLEIMNKKQRNKILEKWNKTDKKFETKKVLPQLFDEVAQYNPNAVAIITKSKILNYQEVYDRANQLASYLMEYKVKNNVLVEVVLEKGWEQIVTVLGIMKAGAAYLPISVAEPNSRLLEISRQSEAKIVITQSKYINNFTWPKNLTIINIDEFNWNRKIYSADLNYPNLEDLAYVIFTSGSTGEPKGVMIEHQSVINTILDINDRFNINEKDSIFALSNLNFDLSVYDIFGALISGASVILPTEEERNDPGAWLDLLKLYPATIWNTVPALMNMLVEWSDITKAENIESLKKFRLVLMSGDWIPLTLPERVNKVLGNNTKIVSLGGATEASIWSIFHPISKLNPDLKSIPYGRPLKNQRFYILNRKLQPVPIGVNGELYIAGTGLARGYWRNENKTKAVFIYHPEIKKRLYKTGDMGKYMKNGDIIFLGRNDHQIKINGFRIELGEIESAISQYKGIEQQTVIVNESKNGKLLTAYYISSEKNITSDLLKHYLEGKLPRYMVPSAYVKLSEFPLTSNGKIDRTKLPLPLMVNKAIRYVKPTTKIQHALADIWSHILKIKKIGICDDFFKLGGNSLSAIQVAAKAKSIGITLTPRQMFETPTIEELCKTTRKYQPIFSFNTHGDKPNLFLVHPGGYGTEAYMKFIQFFNSDQPIYAIENYNLYSKAKPVESIEKLARIYIKHIKQIQPDGPYYIGGWSQGGIISFEIALQLNKQGDKVKSLYLIDPFLHAGKLREDKLVALNEVIKDKIYQNETMWLEQMANVNYIAKKYDGECLFFKSTKYFRENIKQKNLAKIFTEFEDLAKQDLNGFGAENIPKAKILNIHTHHRDLLVNSDTTKNIASAISEDINKKPEKS
jgi:yersiniabactin nonribosomal peptide synthetase